MKRRQIKKALRKAWSGRLDVVTTREWRALYREPGFTLSEVVMALADSELEADFINWQHAIDKIFQHFMRSVSLPASLVREE